MIDRIKKQEDKQYQRELQEFLYKNPNATESFYLNYRIRITEKVLVDYENTADFTKGEELDGKELVNGILTTTKTGTASEFILFYKELDFLKYKLVQLSEPQKTNVNKKEKDFKAEYWFKVGLLFATGEIYLLLEKHNGNATKIAEELGNKSHRVYITQSNGGKEKTNHDKNIFSKPDKLHKIYSHCIDNKIDMCEEFLNKYTEIEPK